MARVRQVARILEPLVYLDGPQLLLLEMPDQNKLIAAAVTIEGKEYPFFAAKISDEQWNRYLRQFVDLHYLFTFPSYKKWYLFDLCDKPEEGVFDIRLVSIGKEDIPFDKYSPSPGFFARDHTEGGDLAGSQGSIQRFGIDGSWGAGDFSRFNGQLDDIYSLLAALNDFADRAAPQGLKRTIADAFSDYPFRGGSSYVHFYDDLERVHPFEERLVLDKIQYQSPGFVDVKGRPEILFELRAAIQSYAEMRGSVREKYLRLERYLRNSGLLKESAKRFQPGSALEPHIMAQARTLAGSVSFRHLDLVFRLTDSNALAASKVVLSFVRRLERAFMFFAEGRVKFGG